MNESDFKDLLAEICEEEISELNKFSPFKSSLRHMYTMKRIFALLENNARKDTKVHTPKLTLQSKNLRLSRRVIILFVVIICAALLTGFIAVYVSKNFHGTIYKDYTQIFAVNTENCLTTIEYKYYLPELPEGFEMIERNSTVFDDYTKYRNLSGQTLAFYQCIKNDYGGYLNTEHRNIEEIEINGHNGLHIYLGNSEFNHAIIF